MEYNIENPMLFERVDLLVHPFFAAENARVRGRANSLINVTAQDVLADYDFLGLVENWRKRLQECKANPKAIMIVVGQQEIGSQKPRRFFFQGGLQKQKLAQFTAEYQAFLHEAKHVLGNRLFYLSHSIERQEQVLCGLFAARRMLPAQRVRLYGFGEYLGKTKKQCVDHETSVLSGFVRELQRTMFKRKPKRLRTKKLHHGKKTKSFLSILPNELSDAEIIRQLERSGRVSTAFLRRRIWVRRKTNLKKFASHWNNAYQKRKRELARRKR